MPFAAQVYTWQSSTGTQAVMPRYALQYSKSPQTNGADQVVGVDAAARNPPDPHQFPLFHFLVRGCVVQTPAYTLSLNYAVCLYFFLSVMPHPRNNKLKLAILAMVS